MTATRTEADHHELAGTLQLEVCAGRLLGYLFPFSRTIPERPGRHRLLTDAIEGTPGLLRALLDADREQALRAWSRCLRERGKDLRFQHVLAVLYRERALTAEDSPAEILVFATTLWALLVSTEEFWALLDQPAADDRNRLVEKVLKELLALQVVRGNRELAAGRSESARPYLRCLKDILAGSLTETLATYDLHYGRIVDDRLMAHVRDIAEDVLNNWCADTVKAAKQSVDDPQEIERLHGIPRNYEGGIRVLEPFAAADVPVPSVLRTGLEWYNDWREALYKNTKYDQIGELSTRAGLFADRLVPVCRQGDAHKPENNALSRHFLFCGFAAGYVEDDSAVHHYEESVAWDPGNSNAKQLLCQVSVRRAKEAKDWDRAEELLRAALTEPWSESIREKLTTSLVDILMERVYPPFDKAVEEAKHFNSVADEIVSAVKRQLSTNRPYRLDESAQAGYCAVCADTDNVARVVVISTILDQVKTTGRFTSNGMTQFWTPFREHLCPSCLARLRSIRQLHREALSFAEQAHELDPGNPSISKTIETIRKLNL